MTDDIDEIVRELRECAEKFPNHLKRRDRELPGDAMEDAAEALERLKAERDESKAALARLGGLSIKADQAINIIVNEFSVMKARAEAAEADYRTVCEGLVQCHRERAQAESRAEAAEKRLFQTHRPKGNAP